jgi:hypothetical protein
MIVESHSHVSTLKGHGGLSPANYGKPMEGLAQYLETYDQNGVEACWVLGELGWLDSEKIVEENNALSQLRRKYPTRLYPFGTVNPNWPEKRLRGEIQRMAKELNLCGIKLVTILQGGSPFGPGMDVLADEAIKMNLPIFFHDGSPEYSSAIQIVYFARQFPQLRVVAGHSGLRELWPDHMRGVADTPNLWLCLSGPTQWGLQKLYDALGPDRLMWGSDGGLGTPAVIKAYLRRIERLKASDDHKRMILGENAMRFMLGDDWKNRRKRFD